MQTTFADTLLNISVTGALVRLELGTVVPAAAEGGQQQLVNKPSQLVVMPLEGFLRAFGMQETVVKKLIADGVIKLEQPAASAAN